MSELTTKMREAADFLEKLNEVYAGNTYQWSPDSLRYEADYLDRPVPGEAS